MLHLGSLNIRTDIFVLFISIVIVLLQLLICFKVKRNIFRLIPVYLFSGIAVIFSTLGFIFDGWDSFGFFFLAICSALPLLSSGVAWGLWALIRKLKNR